MESISKTVRFFILCLFPFLHRPHLQPKDKTYILQHKPVRKTETTPVLCFCFFLRFVYLLERMREKERALVTCK